MDQNKIASAEQSALRLIVDERPPLATKIYLLGAAGVGFIGQWYAESNVVAWSPLPRLTVEQKTRLRTLMAEGIDVTQPRTK